MRCDLCERDVPACDIDHVDLPGGRDVPVCCGCINELHTRCDSAHEAWMESLDASLRAAGGAAVPWQLDWNEYDDALVAAACAGAA